MARRQRTLPRRVDPDERLTVVQHLDELRNRLVISLVSLVVIFGGLFAFHGWLLDFLEGPLPGDQVLVTLAVSEPFFTVVKVVLACTVIAAMPIWLYHAYAYVVPAIGAQSRRRMLLSVAGIAGLFLAGAAFGFFVVLPVALEWLQSFGEDLFVSQLRASEYYSFVTTFVFASGLMFEIPIAMMALARLGLVQARVFVTQWRWAVVVIAVLAALLPGGDPMSMILLMVPQLLLYALGVALAKRFGQPAPWSSDLWKDAQKPAAGDPEQSPT